MNFCIEILILKMEEYMQHFLAYYALLFPEKKGKNASGMQKKRFLQCTEKVLWLIEHVKSGLQSFVLDISHWRCSTVW